MWFRPAQNGAAQWNLRAFPKSSEALRGSGWPDAGVLRVPTEQEHEAELVGLG